MTVENRYIHRGAWKMNYELVFSYGNGVFLRIRVSILVKRSSCEKSWSARNGFSRNSPLNEVTQDRTTYGQLAP
jgi:hypothetical protein